MLIKCDFLSTKFPKHIVLAKVSLHRDLPLYFPHFDLVDKRPFCLDECLDEFVSIRVVSSDRAGISLTFWDLSAEAGLSDRVTFPWQPGSSVLGTVTEIVRMTARVGAVSQLRRVVILEGPSLPRRTG